MNSAKEVDLLDCSFEPSDEQLESLMRSVVEDACTRARIADTALMNNLRKEIAQVRKLHNLPYLPRGSVTVP